MKTFEKVIIGVFFLITYLLIFEINISVKEKLSELKTENDSLKIQLQKKSSVDDVVRLFNVHLKYQHNIE